MTDKKMKVAQVGCGNFGAYRRARLRETGLFELVAVWDHNPEAMAAAQREDGARPAASFDDLLNTPGIEALVVSTGGKFHAEQAIAAMARGLHVFVEKPLCATPEEMRAMLAAQKKAGVVAGCGHHDHAHEAISATIKRMIDSGELGTVAAIEKTTAHSGGFHIKPGDWRGDPAKNPGGMLFQCGVHGFHELMFYFGPIVAVSAMMRYDVHTTQTADAAICMVRFQSGLIGSLHAYHVTPYRHTLGVMGTKLNLYRDDRFFDEGVKLVKQPLRLDGSKEVQEAVAADKTDNDPCGNVRSFYQAVRQGGEPSPSLRDGARAVAVVFGAEVAAKTGTTVDLVKMFPELY